MASTCAIERMGRHAMIAEIEPRPIRQSDRHYVIVVHGTFNRPEPGKPHWAAVDSTDPANFAHKLNLIYILRLHRSVLPSIAQRMKSSRCSCGPAGILTATA